MEGDLSTFGFFVFTILTVVVQGPNLIPAGIVAVDAPPGDDPEWASLNQDEFNKSYMHIQLSIEDCPYSVL